MDKDQLSPGTVLADKYRLESVLGEGGMGTVYRAEHLALKAPVAVKVIDRKIEEGDVTLSRFMREAQSAAALRSAHVVQILDYGTDHGRPFMVMELLEGEPLADRLKRVGRLSPEETYQIILHVAKAVSKAHEAEIVHRDLKPDNIFLVHNEGDELAKVLDFGVAKVEATALDGAGHTRTGSLLGTPYYMSPEQAQGNKDVDGRSDLWALGVIAFECLTGVRPFSSDGLGDLVLQICIRDIPVPSNYATVPAGFDDWFKKACEREPGDRFQTARELAEALRPALELDSGSIPESRWAPMVERAVAPRSVPLALAEELTIDESDTNSRVEERTDNPPSSIRSSEAGRLDDRTILEEPRSSARGSALASSDDWQVVPHGTVEASAPSSPRLEEPDRPDPLADTYEPPTTSSPIAFVALFAIVLGALSVYGLSELGIVSFGKKQDNTERLKVIGAKSSGSTSTEPTEGAPKTTAAADEDAKAVRHPSKKTGPKGTLDKESASEESPGTSEDGANDGTDTGDASDAADAAPASPEAQKLEEIEKEAKKAIEEIRAPKTAPEPPNKGPDGQPPAEPKTERKETGPQPVLPDELEKTPSPPPPPVAPDGEETPQE